MLGPIQSGQTYRINEKSDFLLPYRGSRFVQEESKYQYVGAEKCASVCHNNEEMGFQYNIWKESNHSRSYLNLVSGRALRYAKNAGIKGNPQENPECLKCHITGGGLDSSFFAVTYKKEDGVTCEACHKAEYITAAFLPKEKDCLKCHNDSMHKIHKFDFNKKCKKIAHPRPETKQEES
jgi:hypothetical protein